MPNFLHFQWWGGVPKSGASVFGIETSFFLWYRGGLSLLFGIEILHCVVRHQDPLLSGINPGLDILQIGGQKEISIPTRSKNLDTQKRHLDTN